MSARSCGDCSFCCKLLEISAEHAPEAAHEAGSWCRHCARPACRIYDQRPALCREFSCEWLKNPRLGDEWFPPVAGMLLTFNETASTLFVVTDKPNAHLEQPYRFDLEKMAAWGRRSPTPFEVKITGP